MVDLDRQIFGFPDRTFLQLRRKLQALPQLGLSNGRLCREYLTEGLSVCYILAPDRVGTLICIAGIRPPETLWNWTGAAYWAQHTISLIEAIKDMPRQPWVAPVLTGETSDAGISLSDYRRRSNEEREVLRMRALNNCLTNYLALGQQNGTASTRKARGQNFPGFPPNAADH
ncbi:hypothetical protein CUV01_08475 [Paracoccus tegillarcae]|uniref:Uncharacterized protein n=1 Tax=Paracoccus tegillarcae TaxID=1529068 RepID=A0A2K9F2Q3_9RHOB|nr:hypothetical protein CUV01_08475 [Paracoccus tegillarcae]